MNPLSIANLLSLIHNLQTVKIDTIGYSSKRKKEREAKEALLMHDIEVLERLIVENLDPVTFQNLNEQLVLKKEEFEKILSDQAEGAYIRARAQYKMEGEKPSSH